MELWNCGGVSKRNAGIKLVNYATLRVGAYLVPGGMKRLRDSQLLIGSTLLRRFVVPPRATQQKCSPDAAATNGEIFSTSLGILRWQSN